MRRSGIDKNTSYCEEGIYTPDGSEVCKNATLYHHNKKGYYVKLRSLKDRKRYLKAGDIFSGQKSKTVIKIQSRTRLSIYDTLDNFLGSIIYHRS